MPFPRAEVDVLLAKCHRRCCICHRFCGTKIETDHIVPYAQSQDNNIQNAIPVCFECHAEIHSYNDKHPRGRKFRPEELRQHKDQWLTICDEKPEVMLLAAWDRDVGPLQALMDELEYNRMVIQCSPENNRGALFQNTQFKRAIKEGMIAILQEDLKTSILEAYVSISCANQFIFAEVNQDVKMKSSGSITMRAREALEDSGPLIEVAYSSLEQFLTTEESS